MVKIIQQSTSSKMRAINHESGLDVLEKKVFNISKKDPLSHFLKNELEHPSKPVKIKILGSSSVAGQGGTGYSATGENIGTTGYKANEAGFCWANQLKRYIETKYNGVREFNIDNPFFTIENEGIEPSGGSRLQSNSSCRLKTIRRLYGTKTKITIPFYGDSFKFYYVKGTGIYDMEVSIDGGSFEFVSGYNLATSFGNVYQITGLSSGFHTAVIKAKENTLTDVNGRICIESVEFNKKAIVKNWAVSATGTDWMWINRSTLIESDDTIIWNQMGSNDRSVMNIEGLKQYHKLFIDYVKGLGKSVVLSSTQAVANTNDYLAGRLFNTIDMDIAFRELANEYADVYFISNYNALIRYLQNNPSATISTVLVDDQHPNDTGYRIIFESLMKQLEMGVLKREDTTLG